MSNTKKIKLMKLPPLQDGFCNGCQKDKMVVQLSGLEKGKLTTYLCPPCVLKVFRHTSENYQFRYCYNKECQAILCFEQLSEKELCNLCTAEQGYEEARQYNPLLDSVNFLSQIEEMIETENKKDIN